MAKILLVDPPWYVFQHIKSDSVSLGIIYIATVLKKDGHECLIYNGDFSKEALTGKEGVLIDYNTYISEIKNKKSKVWIDFRNVLKNFKPDYVGISMITPKYATAVETAKIVKDYNPKIPVFVGGLHPTIQPKNTLKEKCFDFVVVGEGEETVSELIDSLQLGKKLSSIKSIYYKENEKIIKTKTRPLIEDIDTIPYPDFTLMHNFEEYPPNYLNRILTSRGCPFNCTYCASKNMWTKKVRFRTSENVFEEIKERYEKLGIRTFKFNDDTFTLNTKGLKSLCNKIIEDNMKISWSCDTRADKLNEDTLKLMKAAGCYQINIGVESGSQKIFNSIQKGESLESIRKTFKLTKKVGISTLAYFMMGLPNETKKDVLKSLKFMKELNPDIVCWSLYTPYPGNELYNKLTHEGLLPEKPDWSQFFHHSPEMNFSKNISKKEWIDLIEYMDHEISEYNLKNAINILCKNPTTFVFKRLSIYRKSPHQIIKDVFLVPMVCDSVLKKFIKKLKLKIKH